MSVAFTREEDLEATAADLPDRPVSPHANLVTPEGRLVITCAMGARRSDGLRITGFVVTPAAAAHRNWPKLHDVLARCVLKSQR